MATGRAYRLVWNEMSLKGPPPGIESVAAVAACSTELQADFDEVVTRLVTSGIDEFEVAQDLLEGHDHPHLAPIAADAITAGWPPDIVRRTIMLLSSWNKEEVLARKFSRGT